MAEEEHIAAELMHRFLTGETSRGEGLRVMAHLIHGCDQCASAARRLLDQGAGRWYPSPGEPATAAQLDEAIQRVFEAGADQRLRLAVERLQGGAQWAALAPLLPEERTDWVRSYSELWTWGFHQRLLEASRWHGRTDPLEAVDIVRLALLVAERIEPSSLGSEAAREDLIAETLARLGNAERRSSQHGSASQSFLGAWEHQLRGTGDPGPRACITRLEAEWMIDMGELETAAAMLEEAALLYRRAGEPEQGARTRLRQGIANGSTDVEKGVRQIRAVLRSIDGGIDPRTHLCAQHQLVWFLVEAGQPREALQVLDAARPLFRQFPDDHAQMRLHWLEGKIARHLDSPGQAVSIFRQLLAQLDPRALRHEIVLVTIDLVDALAADRQWDEAAGLVRRTYPLLASWELHRWPLAAWRILQDALDRRQPDDLFSQLRTYYQRHWHRPEEFRQ